ncbi:MAG: SDR family NAD(P)-dependent oxidoreductase [Victivallaceae bacterium]|nr:SDR family NAD(P)-dependent oxidoreductase [Victivallaceae bacterium]
MIISDKVILITGGTGSVGIAAARRFLKSGAREVRIFSRDPKKQAAFRREFTCDRLTFHAGDILDRESLDNAMGGVDYVLSTAAVKEIPVCEADPFQAININVFGTGCVIDSAIAHNVKSVVAVSTDKAAYPISAMGISKAMMEKVAAAKARKTLAVGGTKICCVRYSNVMGSRGSVIPRWIEQIKAGKPITITDPDMTRFMMTLNDAVDLAVFAWEHGENGDLIVKKTPAATLKTLAEALKELYSSDVAIRVTGARPGEKLYETLLTREEMVRAVEVDDYYRVPCDGGTGTQYNGNSDVDYHSHNAPHLQIADMKELLVKSLCKKDVPMP